MKDIIFKNLGVALVTPFNEDHSINFDHLKDLIEFYYQNNVSCLVALGTTAETACLSLSEYEEVIKFVVEHNKSRMKIIAGCGTNDTISTLSRALICQKYQVDGLLVVAPYYNKPTQEGIFRHYEYIAKRVNTKIVVYNVPSRTGISINELTYKRLMELDNINSVKEASPDISLVIKTKALCNDNLHIYAGNDDQILPVLAYGGLGVISVLGNVIPYEVDKMCRLFNEGDHKGALDIAVKYQRLAELLFIESNPVCVKTALYYMNRINKVVRLPLCNMSSENEELLKNELIKLKLI